MGSHPGFWLRPKPGMRLSLSPKIIGEVDNCIFPPKLTGGDGLYRKKKLNQEMLGKIFGTDLIINELPSAI